jgi:hypothetical protein
MPREQGGQQQHRPDDEEHDQTDKQKLVPGFGGNRPGGIEKTPIKSGAPAQEKAEQKNRRLGRSTYQQTHFRSRTAVGMLVGEAMRITGHMRTSVKTPAHAPP